VAGDCGCSVRAEKKNTEGGGEGGFAWRRCGSLLKGGIGKATEGGGEVGRRVGRSGGERGGTGRGGKWLGQPASAPGRQARAAALPRYSDGRRDARGADASG
jgi:hypothetical protein